VKNYCYFVELWDDVGWVVDHLLVQALVPLHEMLAVNRERQRWKHMYGLQLDDIYILTSLILEIKQEVHELLLNLLQIDVRSPHH
jgi:hypothetical protein